MADSGEEAKGGPGSGGSLDDLQAWFGRAISRPLPEEWQGNPLARAAPELAEAGDALIHGRGGLGGFARVGVYNQQYWFRLISIMQEEYPCAVHLLGLKPFNAWAVRYLSAHPPDSPYLARLDAEWPAFLDREYAGADRDAVLQAVAVDRAFSRAVDAPEGLPLSGAGGDLMAAPLRLAPHASVLDLGWDFPAYRALCLADGSLERRIPLEPGPRWLAVWRGEDLGLWQQALPAAAGKVLAELRRPATLEEAFARLEGRLDAEEQAALEAGLAGWFAEWTRAGILSLA